MGLIFVKSLDSGSGSILVIYNRFFMVQLDFLLTKPMKADYVVKLGQRS